MIIRKGGPQNLTILAPAKVNLFLEVLSKRPDGFHELDTVMHTVALYDTREIRRAAGRCSLETTGLDTGPLEENLTLKAARLFFARLGRPEGAALSLEKNIPVGAGLGGGSSDAAAVLLGLNLLEDRPFDHEALLEMAGSLGSDVPFFLHCGTARCRGRGECVTEIPGVPPLDFLIIHPGISISTHEVYQNLTLDLTESKKDPSLLIKRLETGKVADINLCLYNRLEEPALKYEPALSTVLGKTREMGFPSLRVTGTGSSFFQLVSHEEFSEENLEFFHKEAIVGAFQVKSSPSIHP